MRVRVIGIGQRAAGDDGAGPAVIDHLRAAGDLAADVELCEVAEPSALMPLLDGATRVIVVDAALGAGDPGELLVLEPEDLDTQALSPVSTHGLSVGQAIALARVLAPEAVCPDIRLVAVAAARPTGLVVGLSEPVAAAVPRAAALVRSLVPAKPPREDRGEHA